MSTSTRKGHVPRFLIMALYMALEIETAFAKGRKRFFIGSGGVSSGDVVFWLIAFPAVLMVVLFCYCLRWYCHDSEESSRETEELEEPCEAIILIYDPRQRQQS
ncbi:hypothetical protein RRG08_000685 [Elysia crispata]|uniref:Uncharacterized protein n=1 Tax=Elysia crispata TaxID=231223 RepID=A0AAE1E5E4_9GAST|nr:hypothetical protein RRG08_000685 [Elysia crispata]